MTDVAAKTLAEATFPRNSCGYHQLRVAARRLVALRCFEAAVWGERKSPA